jgi:hypothetical protein
MKGDFPLNRHSNGSGPGGAIFRLAVSQNHYETLIAFLPLNPGLLIPLRFIIFSPKTKIREALNRPTELQLKELLYDPGRKTVLP